MIPVNDLSQVQRVSLKYKRKNFYLYNAKRKLLRPGQCVENLKANNSNLIIVSRTELDGNVSKMPAVARGGSVNSETNRPRMPRTDAGDATESEPGNERKSRRRRLRSIDEEDREDL
jgi:hypothetical protein